MATSSDDMKLYYDIRGIDPMTKIVDVGLRTQ